jgi:phage/plasmid-associated DNA primase
MEKLFNSYNLEYKKILLNGETKKEINDNKDYHFKNDIENINNYNCYKLKLGKVGCIDTDNDEAEYFVNSILNNKGYIKNPSISNKLLKLDDYNNNFHRLFIIPDTLKDEPNKICVNGGCLDILFSGILYEPENYNIIQDEIYLIPELTLDIYNKLLRFKPTKMNKNVNPFYNKKADKFIISNYINDDFDTNSGTIKFIQQILKQKNDENKFIWIGKNIYCWNGKKWLQNNHEFKKFINQDLYEELKKITDKIINDFKDVIYPDSPNFKTFKEFQKKMKNAEKCWKNENNVINIIKCSDAYFTNDNIKFDENPDLLGFNNGCYDFKLGKFRDYIKTDYVNLSCNFDYVIERDPVKEKCLMDLITSIIPNEDNRTLLLEILSKGLLGEAVENFVIFNNGGRNGKGLINDMMAFCLGDYCYSNCPVAILFEKERTGGNPELAYIHKKRYCVMREPSKNTKFNNGRVKELTGKGTINARMLHSNETKVTLNLVLVLECNSKPDFQDEPTRAEYERLIDLEFPNTFTTDDNLIDNIKFFKAETKYKEDYWRLDYRQSFIHILINYATKLRANKYKFSIPQSIRDRTNKYLEKSFPIIELFNNYYEKSTDNKDFIKLSDIVVRIHNSEEYNNFNKNEKNNYTDKKIREFIKNNPYFDKCYFEEKRVGNLKYKNILVGYKEIITDDYDEDKYDKF